jgi:DNA-binding response OmpR family regulator
VLLDLQMLGKTGHEVLDAIKKNHELSRIPVAILTASKLDDDMALSYGLGSNHFITKPDNPEKLVQQLRVLLEYADNLSGRSGSGNLKATAVSAVDPRSFAVRNFLLKAALAVVIVGLLVFAYIKGV